jgi:hypothetical protein
MQFNEPASLPEGAELEGRRQYFRDLGLWCEDCDRPIQVDPVAGRICPVARPGCLWSGVPAEVVDGGDSVVPLSAEVPKRRRKRDSDFG